MTVIPRCLECGYSLAGLPVGSCPECGKWFDPGIRDSFGPPSRSIQLGALARWYCRGNGWLFNGLTAAVCILLLDAASYGSTSFFAGAFEAVLIVLLFFRLLVAVGLASEARLTARDACQHWRRWFVTPIAILAVELLIVYAVPLRVRWALSRSDFEKQAQRTLRGAGLMGSPVRVRGYVGAMPVQIISTSGNEVWFRTGSTWDGHGSYVVFSPTGVCSAVGTLKRARLSDQWTYVLMEY